MLSRTSAPVERLLVEQDPCDQIRPEVGYEEDCKP
jgi:hypothetical protein